MSAPTAVRETTATARDVGTEAAEIARRHRARRTRERVAVVTVQALLVAGVVAFWEIGVNRRTIDPFFYAQPSAILDTLGQWFGDGSIWRHLRVTMWETTLGYAVGAGSGMVTGFVLGHVRPIARVLEPFIAMVNGVPKVVLAPLFILWFGISTQSKVALAASIVFFIVFYAVFSGVRDVDQDFLDRARVLGASRTQILTTVLLPATLTWIFSSLRVSVGLGLGGAVVGEYLAANEGLGFLIATSQASFRTTGVMAGITVLMVVSILLNGALALLERRFAVWKT